MNERMIFDRFLKGRRLLKILSLIPVALLALFIPWKPDFTVPQQLSADLPACSSILTGDLGNHKEHLEVLLSSVQRRVLLSEDFYINVTQECEAYVAHRGFFMFPLSEEERDFPIAYSMVIHDQIEMFERLLRAVYAPQNVYCVHVDRKSTKKFHLAVEAIVSCFENVFIAGKLESVVYASWSRVQADLNCMESLARSHVKWRYLLNTCGTDFPIKTNREIVQVLKALRGRNSMETEATNDYKKQRWQYHYNVSDSIIRTDVKKSPPPIRSPMFSGNAYFVVTRAFVEHVLHDKEVKALLEWEKDTYSPDEHLWATLQRMPSVPGSMPANAKYDVSDMQAMARVVKWSYLAGDVRKGAPYDPCTGVNKRAVCVYGAGDLQWLLRQHHLLANKFDPLVDDIVIRCLEAILYFKASGTG
ncbi:beta-1,3-galactosyl-O-glycosyl-glycoprotein beta-1,6-N-acetylglucosaminyltransferase 3 [Dunckerocampus dactyliophorus]|uniref:beta-1,3-galactosyl-O-glycosyl-glycoprotein beta-1,6-N-acetylglucosaminyltransferase 3 n=1 Tax=Dunckerocampus dactyliophorus TaxID=161453 RepID=UPI0024067164|nr:beta-1,3-galactosyl-O-glycosyl-glycoprotein beta-1,6-N-acetylglucosaminyltransferase 3 [Dunckerocampus dactyliophorus]